MKKMIVILVIVLLVVALTATVVDAKPKCLNGARLHNPHCVLPTPTATRYVRPNPWRGFHCLALECR